MPVEQHSPTDASALKARILGLVQNSEFRRAKDLCEKLCRQSSGDAEAWFLSGAIDGQLNNFQSAVTCFNMAITLRADIPAVYFNLGVAHYRLGNYSAAEYNHQRAIQCNPGFSEAYLELGNALRAQDKTERAIENYRHALALQPAFPAAYCNLANAFYALGNLAAATENYRHAVRLDPTLSPAYYQLGICATELERIDDAITAFQEVIALNPDHTEAWNGLGIILRKAGRLDEALRCCQKVLELDPVHANGYANLATILQDLGRLDEALVNMREALRRSPDEPKLSFNLAGLLHQQNALDEAEGAYLRAIELQPDFPEAFANLGNLLLRLGRHSEAIVQYKKALVANPDLAEAHGNLLFALNYDLDLTAESIWQAHRSYGRHLCERAAGLRAPHNNARDKAKRLRVGYVSGDFRMHPVAHFIEPILVNHDRANHEIYCYANHAVEDDVTARLRRYADSWRNIYGQSDEAVTTLIARDNIDILVDLSGYSHGNRLAVFAREPAPVQISWLGYLNTTGLDTMHYRIVDSVASPPGMFDSYHSEQLLRMPHCQWCYLPPVDAPDVSVLPALGRGEITFASTHSTAKITPPVLRAWMTILAAIPSSRLILMGNGLERRRAQIEALARAQDVNPTRLEYINERPFAGYLAQHLEIDINLDAFPYCGGTSTCHSLWMGVPVITLAGQTVISRGGASLLDVIGLGRLTAYTIDEYVEKAISLANDPESLAALRCGLRPAMLQSPLVDAIGYTKQLETAYREVWSTWCRA